MSALFVLKGSCRLAVLRSLAANVSGLCVRAGFRSTKADKDWYDTLEIYSLNVGVAVTGKLFAEISAGDDFASDHILDIEIEENKIIEMNYDG